MEAGHAQEMKFIAEWILHLHDKIITTTWDLNYPVLNILFHHLLKWKLQIHQI